MNEITRAPSCVTNPLSHASPITVALPRVLVGHRDQVLQAISEQVSLSGRRSMGDRDRSYHTKKVRQRVLKLESAVIGSCSCVGQLMEERAGVGVKIT